MAHFALLDENNIVQAVFAGRDEDENNELGLSERTGNTYKRTSYNTKAGVHYSWINGEYTISTDQSKAFRKNFAGIGFTYDAQRDAFIAPKPFSSWILDENTCIWKAPVNPPELTIDEINESYQFRWDENQLSFYKVKFNPITDQFEAV